MSTKTRVLIVDDHLFTREGIRFFLEDTSAFEVVGEASDGQEAIEKAIDLQPDIVTMDLRLRGIDGLETTRRLRQLVPSARVVVLTVEKEEDHLQEARQAGVCGWMSKGSSPARFIEALATVSAGESLLC